MIDHFGITVQDLEKSKAFYQATLAPLGYELRVDNSFAASFAEVRSADPAGDFLAWIRRKVPANAFCFQCSNPRRSQKVLSSWFEGRGF